MVANNAGGCLFGFRTSTRGRVYACGSGSLRQRSEVDHEGLFSPSLPATKSAKKKGEIDTQEKVLLFFVFSTSLLPFLYLFTHLLDFAAAIWLWNLGQGLLLENWLAGWAVSLAFGAMYLLRVPREEAMMLELFGEPYQRYMGRTGRIIPRLRRVKGPSQD
jgi:hypothetical protein